jgi:muconolactone delta-isomerase
MNVLSAITFKHYTRWCTVKKPLASIKTNYFFLLDYGLLLLYKETQTHFISQNECSPVNANCVVWFNFFVNLECFVRINVKMPHVPSAKHTYAIDQYELLKKDLVRNLQRNSALKRFFRFILSCPPSWIVVGVLTCKLVRKLTSSLTPFPNFQLDRDENSRWNRAVCLNHTWLSFINLCDLHLKCFPTLNKCAA